MSYRIFTAHSRKQDMMLLSGWLFADLLLGLMTIFMAAIPPHVTQPPTLIAHPTALSLADTQHCHEDTNSALTCTITLSESAKSDGNVSWTPSSDMSNSSNTVQFSPATGTLSPGQPPTTITITKFPCQNGSFIINGSRNAVPVVITWQCQLPPVQLEHDSVSFSIPNIDVTGLLNNSPQAISYVEQKLREQPYLANRSVGLAIVSGGTGSNDDQQQGIQIANAIYHIMQLMQNDPTFTAFQRASYYAPLMFRGGDPSIVLIDVYRYKQ